TRDTVNTFYGIQNTMVCRDCNTKWMSVLENRAKSLLTGLMSKQTNVLGLSENQKQLLGRWTAKTLYAFNACYRRSIPVPAEHIRRIRLVDNFLAPNTAVFAAQTDPRGKEYESRFSDEWPIHRASTALEEIKQSRAKGYKLSVQLRALHLMVANSGD